jgi:tetratricopeptide (TPR) repeat protein
LAAHAPEACATDPAGAKKLALSVGGLPLALELLGGYLAAPERSYFSELSAEAIAELCDPRVRLQLAQKRLGQTSSRKMTLEETIALSVEGLDDKTVAAFYALGAFAAKPARFDRGAAEAVTAAQPRTLALLIARNLVEVQAETLAIHQTLADMARTKLDPTAIARHRDYYLAQATEHGPSPRLTTVYEQVKHAWQSLPEEPLLLDWVWALRDYQELRGLWRDFLDWASRGLRVAVKHGLRADEGALLANTGLAHHALRQTDEAVACWQQAIPILREVADRAGVATTLNNLGMYCSALGQADKALDYHEQALPLFEQAGDRAGVGDTLERIAFVYHALDQNETGAGYYIQAKAIREETSKEIPVRHTNVSSAFSWTGNQELERQPLFLRFIDAWVQGDDAYAGLDGTITFMVKQQDGTVSCWSAAFAAGRKIRAGFLDNVRWDADVMIRLSEGEGDAMLTEGTAPSALVTGNTKLLQDFIERYLRGGFGAGELRQGMLRMVQKRYPEAEAEFTTAMGQGQDDASGYYYRGLARHAQKNYAGAEEDFSSAISRGSEDADVYYYRGLVRHAQKNYAGAEEDFSVVKSRGREDAEIHLQLGLVRMRLQQWRAAERDLATAINKGKDGADVFYVRALVRQVQQNWPEAEADFTSAIDKGRNDHEAYYERGLTRRHQGNDAGAQADLTTAIARGRDDAEVYYQRFLARGSHDLAGAEEDLTSAVDRGRNDARVYVLRSQLRGAQGNFAGAEADLTTAVARGQDDAATYYWRGGARLLQERYSEAEGDFTEAIERGQNDSIVYSSRGMARLVEGNYAGAESDFGEAIKRGEDGAEVYQKRARASVRLGRLEAARRDCEDARQRAPQDPVTHGCWGDLYLADGDYDTAIESYRLALEAASNTGWHLEMGLALLLAGRLEEAKLAYKKGLTEAVPSDVEFALRELDHWTLLHANRLAMPESGEMLDTIRQQIHSALGPPGETRKRHSD